MLYRESSIMEYFNMAFGRQTDIRLMRRKNTYAEDYEPDELPGCSTPMCFCLIG
jgi:hypothetical protein